MSEERKTIVGIDLGTTYSCLAYIDEMGEPQVATNQEGDNTTPSVVSFPEDDPSNVLVGLPAKQNAITEPDRTAQFVKVLMGKTDEALEIDGNKYSPSGISSLVLKKVVEDAKKIEHIDAKNVVITVPAYFGNEEVEATKLAGKLAGLNVLRTVQEPVAAAIYYGCLENTEDSNILVYDLGGGTFDVTVISVSHNGSDTNLQVECADGNSDLGGRLWDKEIVNFLADTYTDNTGFDDFTEYDEQELWDKAEETKKKLSSKNSEKVNLNLGGGRQVITITREDFDRITANLLATTIDLTKKVIEVANGKNIKVDKILLVGGSTRMPQVTETLQANFPDLPIELTNPDEAVARGAAICARESIGEIAQAAQQGADADIDEGISEETKNDAQQIMAVLPPVEGKLSMGYAATKTYGLEALHGSEWKICNIIMKNDPLKPGEKDIKATRDDFCTAVDHQSSVELKIYEHDELEDITAIQGREPLGTAVFDISSFGLPKGAGISITFRLTYEGLIYITGNLTETGEPIADMTVETRNAVSEEEINRQQALVNSLQIGE